MGRAQRLLVVDDEPTVHESCARVFEPLGFEVLSSQDPQAALGMARTADFAAILLDIKMPVMDGMEFLRELRVSDQKVPVIMITGYPSFPTAAEAMR